MTWIFSKVFRTAKAPLIVTLTSFVLGLAIALLLWLVSPVFSMQTSPKAAVFSEIWQTINDNFYDSNFNGVDWPTLREKYQPQALATQTNQEFAEVINQMLAELRTSHTHFYTPDETAYYQLLGIFQPEIEDLPEPAKRLFPNGKFEYTGIGIFTKTIDSRTFISAILDGSPAMEAGLQVGDQVLKVDGNPYHPIQSFAGKANQPVTMTVQQSAEPASTAEIQVIPQQFDTTTLFREAQQASTQVMKRDGKQIGYVHIWSNAADLYQQQLMEDLMYGQLREADGLVLDLRDGWGGGSVSYLNFFTGESPSILNIGRNGRKFTYDAHWTKPVVLLINDGSRSSKEIVAFGFQQSQLGAIVGTPTAGAVVAGRPFLMQDGSLLYVAVADVLVDNQRLEGKGVAPDVPVVAPLEYAQGADPQKEQAIAVLIKTIEQL